MFKKLFGKEDDKGEGRGASRGYPGADYHSQSTQPVSYPPAPSPYYGIVQQSSVPPGYPPGAPQGYQPGAPQASQALYGGQPYSGVPQSVPYAGTVAYQPGVAPGPMYPSVPVPSYQTPAPSYAPASAPSYGYPTGAVAPPPSYDEAMGVQLAPSAPPAPTPEVAMPQPSSSSYYTPVALGPSMGGVATANWQAPGYQHAVPQPAPVVSSHPPHHQVAPGALPPGVTYYQPPTASQHVMASSCTGRKRALFVGKSASCCWPCGRLRLTGAGGDRHQLPRVPLRASGMW
jgi:hypothetical protein